MIKARTAWALGLANIGRVALYRSCVRMGTHPVRRLKGELPAPPFFRPPSATRTDLFVRGEWWRQARWFGWWPMPVGPAAPDWHLNPMTGKRVKEPDRAWWLIPDFDPEVGDIKAVWEASRFDWVLAFAQRAAVGDAEALARLNNWLGDWCRGNPAYHGPNWKCGQETSIRVMHLAMAALILDQTEAPEAGLLDLIEAHLKRIFPTLAYAMAQDNNHGTSEAAGLFIGGSWLARRGRPQGREWEQAGREWLENRARRLIEPDGSFSQYSLNYHRVLIDTLSMAEVWRRRHGLPAFSSEWSRRAKAAAGWLRAMIDPSAGDGPNLGSNDGARLLALTDTDYREFRPAVQLATALFSGTRAYGEDGAWNAPLAWLNVPLPRDADPAPESRVFDDGGYAILRSEGVMALLRYPRFRFRPSHADALHVDLWVRGENHLRDAGTYGYNTEQEWLRYFPGTASHNTVQFDDRDQMPRLGRFLFGAWLQAGVCKPLARTAEGVEFGAGYRDGRGAVHKRVLFLKKDGLSIRDEISGFSGKAVLRWRLKPGNWKVNGPDATDGANRIAVKAGITIKRLEIVKGWESRYYGKKDEAPVLEVEVGGPGSLETEYAWRQ